MRLGWFFSALFIFLSIWLAVTGHYTFAKNVTECGWAGDLLLPLTGRRLEQRPPVTSGQDHWQTAAQLGMLEKLDKNLLVCPEINETNRQTLTDWLTGWQVYRSLQSLRQSRHSLSQRSAQMQEFKPSGLQTEEWTFREFSMSGLFLDVWAIRTKRRSCR